MPLVAIVGRPNVGKSTLFNRLTDAGHAIVHDEPGVTRDRVYGTAFWNGVTFDVVDTGGYVPRSADRFDAAIREQVEIALEEATAVLFMVDVKTGVTDLDLEMAALLRRADRPVFVVVNKADNDERRWAAGEFYQLGLEHVFAVSSINGIGTGNLLDAVVEAFPPHSVREEEDDRLRLAIIGRPNVGKSSLTNQLLGRERSIVTEISGTTRDAIHDVVKYHGQEIVLIDTAGLRKRAKVRENVEFYSTLRTERAIRECDVALLLLDATQGLEQQDIRVLKQAETLKKGLVLVINKWDLVEKETNTARDYERHIHDRLKTLSYVPVLFISALTTQRIHRVLETALTVAAERDKRVPTAALNEVLQKALSKQHPPMYRNRRVQIKYASQVRQKPPVFAFFCNQPKGIRESYQRYLENQIRAAFGFEGVPVTLVFKAKSKARAEAS
ncbi:MAG: ribosome biogenesis GTPase Der [Bacteroidota bacterium]